MPSTNTMCKSNERKRTMNVATTSTSYVHTSPFNEVSPAQPSTQRRKRRRRRKSIGQRQRKKKKKSSSSSSSSSSNISLSSSSPSSAHVINQHVTDILPTQSCSFASDNTIEETIAADDDAPPDDPTKGRYNNFATQEAVRMSTATIFKAKYYENYDNYKLTGNSGLIPLIQKDLGLTYNHHNTTKQVIVEAKELFDQSLPYDPSRKSHVRPDKRCIKPGSLEMDLFVTYHKQGLSYRAIRDAMMNVTHFRPNNLQ